MKDTITDHIELIQLDSRLWVNVYPLRFPLNYYTTLFLVNLLWAPVYWIRLREYSIENYVYVFKSNSDEIGVIYFDRQELQTLEPWHRIPEMIPVVSRNQS